MYFSDCASLTIATSDPHYLLQLVQLSRTQVTVKELSVIIDEEEMLLCCNRSYCAGVKICVPEKIVITQLVTKNQPLQS